MGVRDLQNVFTTFATPLGTATAVMLDYDRKHDAEFQILTVRGIKADGTAFEVKSQPLRAGTDLIVATKALAQQFVQDNPAGVTPPVSPMG